MMTWKTRITCFAAAILTLCRFGLAAEPSPAQTIAPFVNDQTVSVWYADLKRADIDVTEKWVRQAIQNLKPGADVEAAIAAMAGPSKAWREQMIAAGATEVFVLWEMPNGKPPCPTFHIVPLNEQSDADAIAGLLISGAPNGPHAQHSWNAKVLGSAVVSGRDADMVQVAQRQAKDRPELALALEGDAAVRIALIPSEQLRQMVEQKQQEAAVQPPGGRPMATLARSLRWGSLSLNLSPAPSLRVLIQAESPDAAAEVQQVIADLVAKGLRAVPQGGLPVEPDEFTPRIQNDRLVLEKNTEQLQQLLRGLVPAVVSARQNAIRVQSMSNIRQLLMASHMYMNENKGVWPDDLQTLVDKYIHTDAILRNPRGPEHGKFEYIKPQGDWKKNAANLVVIYESFDPMPDLINVGYADGHVESMLAEQAMQRVEETKKSMTKE